jgi:hypothetical protein
MGYHHFHLETKVQKRGHIDRTDDLIFAEVQRDAFNVTAIFGHDVFDPSTTERKWHWSVHEQVAFRCVPPGSASDRGSGQLEVSTNSASAALMLRFAACRSSLA